MPGWNMCAGSEAWTKEIGDPSGAGWHLNAGMKAASRGLCFSGLAAAVRDGADAVAGRYDAGRMPGCVGCLSRLGSGAGMAAGRIYWLGRFWGLPVFCGNVISTGGVLYSCVLAASFLGACKERRIRTAGFLILLLVLGMGTALEVWLNPGLYHYWSHTAHFNGAVRIKI